MTVRVRERTYVRVLTYENIRAAREQRCGSRLPDNAVKDFFAGKAASTVGRNKQTDCAGAAVANHVRTTR